jgi:hypothetical protein
MATFTDGFGLVETVPTPFGGSAGTQAAPVAVVPPTCGPTGDTNANGFGTVMTEHFCGPVIDTTPADGYLDFCGGVASAKDGFGLPMTMVPAHSTTPQPTAVYHGYAQLV